MDWFPLWKGRAAWQFASNAVRYWSILILIWSYFDLFTASETSYPPPHQSANEFINRLKSSDEDNFGLIDFNRCESCNRTCRDEPAYIQARNDTDLETIQETESIIIWDEGWHHNFRSESFRWVGIVCFSTDCGVCAAFCSFDNWTETNSHILTSSW